MTKIVSIWKSIMLNHNQPWWITMVTLWQWLSFGSTSHCDNHGDPWSNMVQYCIVTKVVSIWKSTMVNHCPISHCDKGCLYMKINHGQPSSNVAFWQRLCQFENQPLSTMFILVFIIFILGFIYFEFIIPLVFIFLQLDSMGKYGSQLRENSC